MMQFLCDFAPRALAISSLRSARRRTRVLVAGSGLLAFGLVNGPGVAAGTDSCQQTFLAVAKSCQAEAQSDFWIASGKCVNLSTAAAQKDCRKQATADLKDARLTCQDQLGARDANCDKLGDAAYDPVIDPANFVATIDNPFFPLTPGTNFIYESQTDEGLEHVEFFVTHTTKVILGVTCVEVHDSVRVNGELKEDTRDWFAQDKDGNVWYFGENTAEFEGGLPTTLAGTFTAGVNGDKPGIIMKAHPAIGDFYRQESSLGNAEDFAEVLSLTESATVPAGSFNSCLKTQETTPLETDLLEHKFYAVGVGNVLTVNAHTGKRTELVQITTGG
jgi:hypothetical protein